MKACHMTTSSNPTRYLSAPHTASQSTASGDGGDCPEDSLCEQKNGSLTYSNGYLTAPRSGTSLDPDSRVVALPPVAWMDVGWTTSIKLPV